MAKITPGTMAGSVSGSIGNQTFSHNRYGPYVRSRVIPTNPQTLLQHKARTAFENASRSWKSVTAPNRLAWKTWADAHPVADNLGNMQLLQANAAYIRLNSRLLYLGLTAVATPPGVNAPTPPTLATMTGDISVGALEIAFAPTPTAGGQCLWLTGCLLPTGTTHFVASMLRFIGYCGAGQASPWDVFTAVTALFGTLTGGQQFFCHLHGFNTVNGQISTPLRADCILFT